jgi:hypothetical protein
MIKVQMLISKYPLLAQDKSWEKKKEKKFDWYGWGIVVAFAKSANWVWTLNFEPHTILWTGPKGTNTPPPPQLFQ